MQVVAKKSDFVWNWLGLFFRMGTSLILLPFLLGMLSESHLGLWYVFLAVSSFVTTFQAGFSPSFARNVTYCWSGARGFSRTGVSDEVGDEVDFSVFAVLIQACRTVYRRISLVALGSIAIFGSLYIVSVASSLSYEEYIPAWSIFCIAIFLNIYFSYYESLLRGVGEFAGINKATIASNVLQLAVSLGLLICGFELVACAMAYLLQGLSFRFLCRRYFYAVDGVAEGLDAARKPSRDEVRDAVRAISPNSYKDTAVSIANYLMTNSNTILCAAFASLGETGVFSVVLQVLNAIANVSAVVLQTYQPTLQSAYSNGDLDLEREISGRVYAGFITLYLAMFALSVIVVFPLLGLVRESFSPDWLLIILMGLYFFLWRLHSTSATLITNTNRVPYMTAFVVSSCLGVVLSAVFMALLGWGVIGLVLGQAAVQLAYNNWKWPCEVSRRLGVGFFALVGNGFASWGSVFKGELNKRMGK